MFLAKFSILASFLFVVSCFGSFPPERPAEADEPYYFTRVVEQVKQLALPKKLNEFNFEAEKISELADTLQDLQKNLAPISYWITREVQNFEKFLTDAGFSDAFSQMLLSEEYFTLLLNIMNSYKIKTS